tara:strand:- start:139 stop:696 length:558 start_codon:yes stop_codon:yes gene_type:complete
MPENQFKFYAPVKVRYNETDLQGHVNFIHYYAYFDVGLIEYMEEIRYGYETMLAEGADFLYAESHCEYKSSAKWPEVLRIYTRVAHMGRRSLRFGFKVRAESDQRLIAVGHIAAVTADKDTFEVRPIPERMRQAVERYEGALWLPSGLPRLRLRRHDLAAKLMAVPAMPKKKRIDLNSAPTAGDR